MNNKVPLPDLFEIGRKAGMKHGDVTEFLELVKRAMEPDAKRIPVIENNKRQYYSVERRGLGILQTDYGKFWEYSFCIDDRWRDYSVIVRGGLDEKRLIPIFKSSEQLVIRIDSGCATGQLFGDRTCECSEQLHLAMETLKDIGEGMIVSIPAQDGRGMGLPFKLGTLWLQEALNVTTVESAALLAPGGVIDVRTYSGVIGILRYFGIPESCGINLATNNPKKMEIFGENGYTVVNTTPVVIQPTELTRRHLAAKQMHLGHLSLVPDEEGREAK